MCCNKCTECYSRNTFLASPEYIQLSYFIGINLYTNHGMVTGDPSVLNLAISARYLECVPWLTVVE